MVNIKKDATTEEKILAAAKKIFMQKGMTGARMQDIADEAGINKALLHYYFRNKEKLFEVIFREAAGRLFPKINLIFDSDSTLFEKIEPLRRRILTTLIDNPYLVMFVMNEIHRHPDFFLNKIWKKDRPRPYKFLEQIEEEVKKGTIKKITPVQLLMNLISLCAFPFISKPIFQFQLGLNESQFREIMEQRKKEIPKFIIDSIKK